MITSASSPTLLFAFNAPATVNGLGLSKHTMFICSSMPLQCEFHLLCMPTYRSLLVNSYSVHWRGSQPTGSSVVVAVDKHTRTTESCGGKGTSQPLSQEESAPTLALTGFYCFSGHIILRMVLIYYAQVCFKRLQKTKERVLLIR